MCRLEQSGPDFQKTGVVSPEDLDKIRSAIRNKYSGVSVSASGNFQYPTGKEGAVALGYDSEIIQGATPQLFESFCGVGNPFSLGKIRQGDVVLDFGCGAGFDMYVAGRLVGENGRVCGVDLTEEMVKRARVNLFDVRITRFEVKQVDSENIPYDDHTFDVVISNGVINLSPLKKTGFKEIYRVLKPGGRLQFADVVLENALPAALTGSLDAWSQ